MNKKIFVDKEKCIGCGLCASVAPEVFEILNGKSNIKEDADLSANEEKVIEAISSCPVNAIEESE